MSLAQAFSAKTVDQSAVFAIAKGIAEKIRAVASPVSIVLFGSAVDGRFRQGSDLDFLLVFADRESITGARKNIRTLGMLHPEIPIDLLFVSKQLYDQKKAIGGVCFVARDEGIEL